MRNKGGRPSTNSWVAILNYWELDENGEANGKGKTLMNHDAEDPSKKLYWPNMTAAIAGLEALQIDGPIKYVIFLKFNNAEFSMKPEEQLHIKYTHTQEEINEEEPEKEEESLIRETPDEVIDANLKDVIEDDKKEEKEENENALPDIE